MSASPTARRRKAYREQATSWARAYLGVKRLPAGVPALIDSWSRVIGPEDWEAEADGVSLHWLAPTLDQFRKRPVYL